MFHISPRLRASGVLLGVYILTATLLLLPSSGATELSPFTVKEIKTDCTEINLAVTRCTVFLEITNTDILSHQIRPVISVFYKEAGIITQFLPYDSEENILIKAGETKAFTCIYFRKKNQKPSVE